MLVEFCNLSWVSCCPLDPKVKRIQLDVNLDKDGKAFNIYTF